MSKSGCERIKRETGTTIMALPNPNPGGAAGAGAATIDGFDNLVDMTGDQKDQLVNLNKGFNIHFKLDIPFFIYTDLHFVGRFCRHLL